jgi:hypothetical protein
MTGFNNQNFPVQSQSGTILFFTIHFEIFKLQVNGHHLLLKHQQFPTTTDNKVIRYVDGNPTNSDHQI